jgi:hypothetical protein
MGEFNLSYTLFNHCLSSQCTPNFCTAMFIQGG